MMKYPMKLIPVSKKTIWGGRHLKDMYGKQAPFDTLGETWELTVRDDGMSVIENGEYSGVALGDYLAEAGGSAVSSDDFGDRFPLLIKFLDANDKLSIQVHPDDAYSLANEGELGKTEMWYVLSADEGAEIVYGLKDGITREAFADHVSRGTTEDALNYVKVKAGDIYFIPSGQVHALGKGIVVAEIQQNSNVTYRVYDYNRRQADGTLRELHTSKAVESVKLLTADEIRSMRFSDSENVDPTLLAHCKYFKVNRYEIDGKISMDAEPTSFVSLLCIGGNGNITLGGTAYPISAGDSYFIPAGSGEFTISGKVTAIKTTLK